MEGNHELDVSSVGDSTVSGLMPPEWPAAIRATLLHRMHVVRMRLMHFVNSLHNYVMTRVGFCLHENSEIN